MTAVAAAFLMPYDTLDVGTLMKYTGMHRLTLERYLNKGVEQRLLSKNAINRYAVTEAGYAYLENHGIIPA